MHRSLCAAFLVGLLIVAGIVTLIGSRDLLRLRAFFSRLHGPAMGNTLGTGSVLIASILVASAFAGRPVLHEFLIALFIVVSSPMSAMMLTSAALYRAKARSTPKLGRLMRTLAIDDEKFAGHDARIKKGRLFKPA